MNWNHLLQPYYVPQYYHASIIFYHLLYDVTHLCINSKSANTKWLKTFFKRVLIHPTHILQIWFTWKSAGLCVYVNAETSQINEATSPSCVCIMKGNICQGIGSLVSSLQMQWGCVLDCFLNKEEESSECMKYLYIYGSQKATPVSSLLPQGSNSGHEAHTASVSTHWSFLIAGCGFSQWFDQTC